MAESERQILIRVGTQLAQRALARVADPSNLPSRTLRETLRVRKLPRVAVWRLSSPFYWARFYHDGRGPVKAPAGKFLVYFWDPKDDPRTGFGRDYPRTPQEVRRLTPAQFAEGMRRNRLLGSKDNPFPHMVVTREVRASRGVPFFKTGLANFKPEAERFIKKEVTQQLPGVFLAEVRRLRKALRNGLEFKI